MNRYIALLLVLAGWNLNAAAERVVIPAQFWFDARSGESVSSNPALAQTVKRLLDNPHATLLIHHAREDESVARAEELRGWLLALGVESSRLSLAETRAVANAADRLLTIEIIENK